MLFHATHWRPMLIAGGLLLALNSASASEPINRILFGSCIKQDRPVPIFEKMLGRKPELMIFLGDNIYADTTDMLVMREKYATLKANSDFVAILQSCPVMATWDDHDFGRNDAGADYPKREEAQRIFVDFWEDPPDSPRRRRPGVYEARIFGRDQQRIQVIMLDTRYFRGPLLEGPRRIGGPYVPTSDTRISMLGEAQWQWLEQQLREPAELRILASSIQCIPSAAGQETWSNLPHEKQRLFELIARTKAGGVIVISGDRHWAELSQITDGVPYPVYDLTSSSFNQIHPRGTPTENEHRILPQTFHRENFGAITVDWQDDPVVLMQIIDLEETVQIEKRLRLSELQCD